METNNKEIKKDVCCYNMCFFVTKNKDGTIDVQTGVLDRVFPKKTYDKKSFEEWKKRVNKNYIEYI